MFYTTRVISTLIVAAFVILSVCNGKPLVTSEMFNIFPVREGYQAEVFATFGCDSIYVMLFRYPNGNMVWPVVGFGGNGLITSFQEDSPLGLYSIDTNFTMDHDPSHCEHDE